MSVWADVKSSQGLYDTPYQNHLQPPSANASSRSRSRSPNGGYNHLREHTQDTTLSTFLIKLFNTAKGTISNNPHQNGRIPGLPGLTPSSSELSLPYLSSLLSSQSKEKDGDDSMTGGSSSAERLSTRGLRIPSTETMGFVGLCGLWYLSSAFSGNSGKSILTRFR